MAIEPPLLDTNSLAFAANLVENSDKYLKQEFDEAEHPEARKKDNSSILLFFLISDTNYAFKLILRYLKYK